MLSIDRGDRRYKGVYTEGGRELALKAFPHLPPEPATRASAYLLPMQPCIFIAVVGDLSALARWTPQRFRQCAASGPLATLR